MNVTLPPDLEQYVTAQIAAGRFSSAGDVIREGLRLLRQQDELRAEIAIGIEQADRGEVAPLRAVDILAEVRDRRGR